jgi:hypothetical protein
LVKNEKSTAAGGEKATATLTAGKVCAMRKFGYVAAVWFFEKKLFGRD